MKTEKDYLEMQKTSYNRWNSEQEFKDQVVGNYDSQEKYNYEKWLLNENGELPFFESTENLYALDFGSGMGRMVKRMNKLFKRADGVDIGDNLIQYSKENIPESNFWVTDGSSCGEAFKNHYDFAFSTICMQHICSHTVRMKIWKSIEECLRPGGRFCFQMMSFRDMDQVNMHLDIYEKAIGRKPRFARWEEDHFEAKSTNSGHDVYILAEDFDKVIRDTSQIFEDCKIYEHFLNEGKSSFNMLYITGKKSL
jgi:SAM-dependent methyltransferase